MDFCGWVVILGIASVEIWESRVGCVSSQGRDIMAMEPPWEQNGLPLMFNIMPIALANNQNLLF